MSQEARTALMVLSPAVAIAALILLLSWRPWQRGERLVRNGHWGGPCALGLGFLAAFFVVAGARGLQLQDRWHWIAAIALLAAIMGCFAAIWRGSTGIRVGSAVALAGVCVSLLHPPAVAGPAQYWKIGLAVTVLVSWITLEPIAEKRRGVALPIAMIIVFSGGSIVLLETQQAGFSLLAAAMAAMCGVALVVALFNPQFTFAHGGVHVIAAILPTLCIIGWMHNPSRIPVWPFVLIVASPLILIAGESRHISRLKPWQGVLFRSVVVALPIAAAVTWTLLMPTSGTR